MFSGKKCCSWKENQWNRQSVGEDKRGAISWSGSWERIPRPRGTEREEDSDTGDKEEGKGWSKEEERAWWIKVSQPGSSIKLL